MKRVLSAAVICLTIFLPTFAQRNKSVQPTAKEIGLASINRSTSESIIEFLASDELEGRESGFHGSYITSKYLASQLKLIGVKPLFDSYFQDFEAYSQDRYKGGRRFSVIADSITKWKHRG